MLRETANKLGNAHLPDDWVARNALLESFTLHARALLDFFYGRRRKKDDALASDFFEEDAWEQSRPPMAGTLSDVNRRVGKEIAHLTYSRANVTEEAKGWPIVPMYLALASVFGRFVQIVPEQAIGRTFLEVAIPLLPTGEPVRQLSGIAHLGSTHPNAVATQILSPTEFEK